MFRRIGILMFTAALVLSLAVPVYAGQQLGSIDVSVDSGMLDVTARRMVLYRVGEETEQGYEITEEFGGGLVFREDALSPYLASMLVQNPGSSGAFRIVDGDNTCSFSLVEPGLYLLMEEGEDPVILPCMTAIPCNDSWNVLVRPAVNTQNPKTGQHPAPILGAVGMVLSGIGLAICAGFSRKK